MAWRKLTVASSRAPELQERHAEMAMSVGGVRRKCDGLA